MPSLVLNNEIEQLMQWFCIYSLASVTLSVIPTTVCLFTVTSPFFLLLALLSLQLTNLRYPTKPLFCPTTFPLAVLSLQQLAYLHQTNVHAVNEMYKTQCDHFIMRRRVSLIKKKAHSYS